MPKPRPPATARIRTALAADRIGKSGTGLDGTATTRNDEFRDDTALASTSCGKPPDGARDSP
jgi:hypothetical protein